MVKVQEFDYAGLAQRMAAVDMSQYSAILNQALAELGSPQYETERTYFWRALANTTRHQAAENGHHQVWLWLCTQFPGLNPTEFVFPQMVPDWELPEIRDTDPVAKPIELPARMSAEPTEENFRAQADRLQAILDERQGRVRSVREYVDTFRHSGTGQMSAQMQLSREGLLALATQEGIRWLIATYPPATV